MRFALLPIIILVLLIVGSDIYIWRSIRNRLWKWVYAASSVLCWALFAVALLSPLKNGDRSLLPTMWILYSGVSVYVVKWVFVICSFIGNLFKIRRFNLGLYLGLPIGILLFCVMWWGALVTRHSIEVKEYTLKSAEVPQAFDGFRIVQFSDAHVGSWGNDTVFVSKLVDKINSLDPDVILFTGDIVNRNSAELVPFTPVLSRLNARHGVWSILGNHDYGDYQAWGSEKEKAANLQRLKDMEKGMGWNLLDNSSAFITVKGNTIALAGVGNYDKRHGHHYCNLNKATEDCSDLPIILMSHNPEHWSSEEIGMLRPMLTLSGHTHAMQMEIDGWSPASWMYRYWGGFYQEKDMSLNVNVGCGEVGFPARIGAAPEVTLITLKKNE